MFLAPAFALRLFVEVAFGLDEAGERHAVSKTGQTRVAVGEILGALPEFVLVVPVTRKIFEALEQQDRGFVALDWCANSCHRESAKFEGRRQGSSAGNRHTGGLSPLPDLETGAPAAHPHDTRG